MNEYIKRQDVIDMLHFYTDECCSAIVEDIEAIPEQNVKPVVHAAWVQSKEYSGYLFCSNCDDCYVLDEWHDSPYSGNYGFETEGAGNAKWKYCPECGAKMDLKSIMGD